MTSKCVKYHNEQTEIVDKIIKILNLDENNSFVLQDINVKQMDQIVEMIPEIRKYFTYKVMRAFFNKPPRRYMWVGIASLVVKTKYYVYFPDRKRVYFVPR